jgi:hypothetical protein
MSLTSVDRLHTDIDQLLRILSSAGEISLRSSADDTYRKSLLLSVASYFEAKLTRIVIDFVEEQTADKHIVVSLVKNKAVSLQYHTWFDWEGNNANSFGSWGETCGAV